MKDILSENLRNIAVVGHGQTGKTSLVSAILFNTGMINRLGRIEQGNTVTDYDEAEIEKKISIQASLAYALKDKYKINIIDTPGYANFAWEVRLGLRAVETGVMIVSAYEGVEVQSEKIFDSMTELKKPLVLVVNKMGKDLSDFNKAYDSIIESFGKNSIAVQYPIGKGNSFSGIVDLIEMKAYEYGKDEKGDYKEVEIPSDIKDEIQAKREELIEKIAENDEKLMEIYFEKEIETLEGKILPDKSAKFSGLVFKTISDPFTGKISIIKVFSGILKPDSTYYNNNKSKEERIGGLFFLQGKNQEPCGEVKPGEIVAVAKLKETQTGDTLCIKGEKVQFPEFKFPVPSISFAIEPKSRSDENKISTSLSKIMEEDPTVKTERDFQTKELIISGNGQLHVELVVNRLKRRYGVEVTMQPPKIPYLETITGKADVEKKYKKQSGGRGQYGHVLLKIESLPRGKGFVFENTIFGGSIPKNYIPAVEKGIREARLTGVLAGYLVVDFKANLYDGSFHEVDSSDMAFKIAASMAFKMGIKQAKPTLLEPIMKVQVIVPEEFMGDINGNLSGRRGRIQGMEPKGKNHVITALVPMAEMLDFSPTLTSITGGRGTYFMELSNYEQVPHQLQKKIIDDAVKEGRVKKEEEE
jgi:elongation factor G